MDVREHVEELRIDGARLADVASSTDPTADVPTCSEWQLRDLVRHIGGVHRWATGFVAGAGVQPPDGDLEQLVGGWPVDTELVAWFRSGHRALVEALMSAPADLEAWTFLDAPSPLAFWARRQAHETAIHRVDAESAAGNVTGFPPEFAADGIDELLLRFVARGGRTLPLEESRSMLVRATDIPRSWHVTFTSTGFQVRIDQEADADLVVTASASDLYTLLWNRRTVPVSALHGQTEILGLWRDSVTIRWS